MAENRNRDSHLTLVAPATVSAGGGALRRAGVGFPLPRRHRRLLATTGTTAAVLLGALSAGTALESLHGSPADASAAAPVTAR
ncbi:hypothetical protein [Peterkaempfera bronchialis]|uniref:Uncharacterized protein n=1 Tax=Peterkaempfera bronchialis TaxID=2126346 RepID=A0A345ST26_9ACTN|nr:hypothetical protein [Peterkaempfera bronchialis]AXI76881.1 hypothetical protein C7M71_004855 [Peterkaempfera bronchialis]